MTKMTFVVKATTLALGKGGHGDSLHGDGKQASKYDGEVNIPELKRLEWVARRHMQQRQRASLRHSQPVPPVLLVVQELGLAVRNGQTGTLPGDFLSKSLLSWRPKAAW